MDNTRIDPITIAFERGLGEVLVPIEPGTKKPQYSGWQTADAPTEDEVRGWLRFGMSLGFRCGSASGIMVIDDDRPKHPGSENTLDLPESGFAVRSPSGSVHWYFLHAPGVRNSAGSRLGKHIDVRGEGGYVVFAGSEHETLPGRYEIVRNGDPSACPQEIIDRLLAAVHEFSERPKFAPRSGPVPDDYQRRARGLLKARSGRLAATEEGHRNQTMFDTALYLGGYVGSGELSLEETTEALYCAADACGLDADEIERTIPRALALGADRPLTVLNLPGGAAIESINLVSEHLRGDILIPGTHVLPNGELVEQPSHEFCDETLAGIEAGTIYRRANQAGCIRDGEFQPINNDQFRSVVDAGVRLVRGVQPKKKSGEESEPDPVLVFRPCTKDLAGILLARAGTSEIVRELRAISAHPVYLNDGNEIRLSRPGWNQEGGVYQDHTAAVRPLPLQEARDLLEELLCDFVWGDGSSAANYVGLLLTPIMRHTISGSVPMHLLQAPDIEAGKTLLASEVLGGILLGAHVPGASLGRTEEEADKRIGSMLLAGKPIVNLDNIGSRLESEALARLLTCSEYEGRLLGQSKSFRAPNRMTLVGTGNNVQHDSDTGRRLVHILLRPSPEGLCYRHDPLGLWVQENRDRLLGALLGLVEHWIAAGRPAGSARFGSFEPWAATIGGIMQAAGWREHLGNLDQERHAGDPHRREREAFVEAWWRQAKDLELTPSTLLALADAEELFQDRTDAPSDRGRGNQWSRVLTELAGNTVAGLEVRERGVGKKRRLWLNLSPPLVAILSPTRADQS